jgi:ATP-dependent helicase HrpB
VLPWSDESHRLRFRLAFIRHLEPSWPDVSDEALLSTLEEWLAPHVHGIRRAEELADLDVGRLLMNQVGWERLALLDEGAPAHLRVPSGSRIPVDYSDPGAPVLAVRMQEMFGLQETPRVGFGRIPVTLHLLSPAGRPVQVTRDLAGFWRNTYLDVRKDLKGRYPRHDWPDDPLAAEPTRRTRARRPPGT